MEFQRSESIAKLALALAKAQGQMKGALKDSQNPFFKSNYADLESVWDACRKPLTDNELSVVQIPSGGANGLSVLTVMMHSSGEYIAGELPLNPKAPDPQGIGSAITYGRRYSLAAFAGVYQTDDDAEKAMGRDSKIKKNVKDEKGLTTLPCERCEGPIVAYEVDGRRFEIGQVLANSRKHFDKDYCANCQKELVQSDPQKTPSPAKTTESILKAQEKLSRQRGTKPVEPSMVTRSEGELLINDKDVVPSAEDVFGKRIPVEEL